MIAENQHPGVGLPLPEPRPLPPAVVAQPVPDGAGLGHPSLYFNRELSWLDFNWRVLHQALDPRTPLLERVRFAAITATNLDEFFQKRIGGLKRQQAAGVMTRSLDGRPPAEQLALTRAAALPMHEALVRLWGNELCPLLRERADVVISQYAELGARQREALDDHFMRHIYPILTPLAVDPGHPFPFISNLSLSLAVLMRHPQRDTTHFARLKVPTGNGRWLAVPDSPHRYHFVPLEQVIRQNLDDLFRGMKILAVHAFRVTRNADLERDEEEAEDLVAMISEELRERRFADVVRLEAEVGTPPELRTLLMRELGLDAADVYEIDGLLSLGDVAHLANLDLPRFRFSHWDPVVPERLQHEGETEAEQNIFSILQRGEILVHHPYESFAASTQRLIDEAADDPQVVAIKQTLYRTSEGSPIVKALLRAAERGKQVAALVEVTARFDEAKNIGWAAMLETAGVHVTYGLLGLKTHAKVTLIVRNEPDGPRTYCHVGTGNYHAQTARLYSDLGLLTSNPDVGSDLVNLFHFLTGYAPEQEYCCLVTAPQDMRGRFEALIRREVKHQRKTGSGRIIAKMNALDDTAIIQELYRASREGVSIDLIVRGHTRLRPGLADYSENIRIRSILGRFLEHDRIYHFHNNGNPEVLIGSADWRQRNLNERVEILAMITDPAQRERLTQVLEFALGDNRLAWEVDADGRWTQLCPAEGEPERNYHQSLMRDAVHRAGLTKSRWKG